VVGNDLNQKLKRSLFTGSKTTRCKTGRAQKVQAELLGSELMTPSANDQPSKTRQADLGNQRKSQEEAEDELKQSDEKDQTITAMQKQIEELKRRAEQGSQQLSECRNLNRSVTHCQVST
jgi:hypothetical protein